MYKIYTLEDPETGEIRYVGKTKNSLQYRLSAHLAEAARRKSPSHKNNWIINLVCKGLVPKITLLEDTEAPNQSEILWIAQLRSWGFRLTNMTDGGDGNNGQVFTEETKKRMSDIRKGKKLSDVTKALISAKHKGRIVSETTREKLRQANLGKRHKHESILKYSKAVIKLDSNGGEIEEYFSVSYAALQNNCRKGSIANVCRGFSKTAGGFKWKYKSQDIVQASEKSEE